MRVEPFGWKDKQIWTRGYWGVVARVEGWGGVGEEEEGGGGGGGGRGESLHFEEFISPLGDLADLISFVADKGQNHVNDVGVSSEVRRLFISSFHRC